MVYDKELIESWLVENHSQLMYDLRNSPKLPGLERVYGCGCFLEDELKRMKRSKEEIHDTCFAFGQRCFGKDPVNVLLEYLKEFFFSGTVQDKSGPELAQKIFKEQFKQKNP